MVRKDLKPGFNFIELMIALVVIGLIMGMIGPKVMSLLGRGRVTTTKNTLKVMKSAVKQFQIDTGKLPESLQDLVQKPSDVNNWDGPYLDDDATELPKDAWGEDLVYKKNDRGVKPPFQLYSHGDPEKEDGRIDA